MPALYTYNNKTGALERFGSFEKFNRVLYGGHANDAQQERFFTFAGDTPIFLGATSDFSKNTWCHQAKNGVLLSGLALTEGYSLTGLHDQYSGWFHDCTDIRTAWHHGYLTYDLTRFSPYFPHVEVHIEVYPLNPHDGFAVFYDIACDQRVLFTAGFGGLTPFFGRFEYHTSKEREYRVEDTAGNQAMLCEGGAEITGPNQTTMRIGVDFPAEWSLDGAEALAEECPAQFLKKHAGEPCVAKFKHAILPGTRFRGRIAVLRNASDEILKELLAEPELARRLRGALREKHAMCVLHTPDERLDATVPDIIMALDASYHHPTFYHGAVGYHAPFLGWRGWYAPTLLGWTERMKSAIRGHFNTITDFSGQERTWWDGADRPDLDHEGTQYHHLENSSGHLTALLYTDDIYNMQEVALDMALYYLEYTGDQELAKIIYDHAVAMLAWEERVLDPDHDGLYQNFLNTWISDGHSYNGAGCAQATCYNCAANRRLAAVGRRLGRDTALLEARAAKAAEALQRLLWQENMGVLAESRDTIGNRLVHPSPELSTIYLAIDCGCVDTIQAFRMLAWTERHIRSIDTEHGRLYYSSNWLPKKYSTCGLFPAENACLALAYYQNRQPERAYEILAGLVDAFGLSPHPGALSHVLAASGGEDDGDLDFTDVSSCYLRLLVEGLWGVGRNCFGAGLRLAPQLPVTWGHAELCLPELQVHLDRKELTDIYTMTTKEGVEEFTFPMRYSVLDHVLLNGEEMSFGVVPALGRSYAMVHGLPPGAVTLQAYYQPEEYPALCHEKLLAVAGGTVVFAVDHGLIDETHDLAMASKRVTSVHNSMVVKLKDDLKVGSYDFLLRCGEVWLCQVVEIIGAEPKAPTPNAPNCQEYINIRDFYNAELTEIHKQDFSVPRPAGYSIGVRKNGRYAWEWNHFGHNALQVDDTKLRVAPVFVAESGWRFMVAQQGDNALCVSQWENFPTHVEIPLSGYAVAMAVLFCGSTNAMQLYIPNACFTVHYADGTCDAVELVPPVNFDDFLHPVYQTANESCYIGEGTHALVQVLRLKPERELVALTVEAIANEVIVDILGITLDRVD